MCSAWIITPCIKLKKSGVHCQPWRHCHNTKKLGVGVKIVIESSFFSFGVRSTIIYCQVNGVLNFF